MASPSSDSDSPWQPDEYSQSEPDYLGKTHVHSSSKDGAKEAIPRSAYPWSKRKRETQAARMRRYRARHRSRLREYQQRYHADRRARLRSGKVTDSED